MPSIQSILLNAGLKRTLKQKLQSTDIDFEDLRNQGAFAATFLKLTTIAETKDIICNEVPCKWVSWPGVRPDRIVLYLHGGAYVAGSVETHFDLGARLSKSARARILMVKYRLAPEYPFPAGLLDALAAYKWLLEKGYKPENINITGDSAGGGLATALTLLLKMENLPLPSSLMLMSPWTDLTVSGNSVLENKDSDSYLEFSRIDEVIEAYTGEESAKNPLISPLFGNFHNFPPVLVHVSKTEMLLDDSVRIVDKMRLHGVSAKLEIWDNMPHVWHAFGKILPEARVAINHAGSFIRQHTTKHNFNV